MDFNFCDLFFCGLQAADCGHGLIAATVTFESFKSSQELQNRLMLGRTCLTKCVSRKSEQRKVVMATKEEAAHNELPTTGGRQHYFRLLAFAEADWWERQRNMTVTM